MEPTESELFAEYRGYRASIGRDTARGGFAGALIGTPDRITFRGSSAAEIEAAMTRAVDDYIDFCLEWGRPLEPPPPGNLSVRLSPGLRRLLS